MPHMGGEMKMILLDVSLSVQVNNILHIAPLVQTECGKLINVTVRENSEYVMKSE